MIKMHELRLKNAYLGGNYLVLSYKERLFPGLFAKKDAFASLKINKKVFLNFLFFEK